MSTLTLKLKSSPPERLNLAQLSPASLAGKSQNDIERLSISSAKNPIRIADIFSISGTPGDTLVFEGGSPRLDYVAANMDGGTIIVDGDVGTYAGHKMRSGRLEIRGNADAYLASSLQDGLVVVSGAAGDHLGGPRPGERDGISGGNIIVKGKVGDFGGERMRRGTIITHAQTGENIGARMMGGTIIATQGFGPCAGIQMRRGMLIAPSVTNMLSTFTDCGNHDLGILRIIAKHLRESLGDLAPTLPTGKVRRFAGDLSSIGRGEILLTQ